MSTDVQKIWFDAKAEAWSEFESQLSFERLSHEETLRGLKDLLRKQEEQNSELMTEILASFAEEKSLFRSQLDQQREELKRAKLDLENLREHYQRLAADKARECERRASEILVLTAALEEAKTQLARSNIVSIASGNKGSVR